MPGRLSKERAVKVWKLLSKTNVKMLVSYRTVLLDLWRNVKILQVKGKDIDMFYDMLVILANKQVQLSDNVFVEFFFSVPCIRVFRSDSVWEVYFKKHKDKVLILIHDERKQEVEIWLRRRWNWIVRKIQEKVVEVML